MLCGEPGANPPGGVQSMGADELGVGEREVGETYLYVLSWIPVGFRHSSH